MVRVSKRTPDEDLCDITYGFIGWLLLADTGVDNWNHIFHTVGVIPAVNTLSVRRTTCYPRLWRHQRIAYLLLRTPYCCSASGDKYSVHAR
jgi:hypothetical protein